MPWCRKILVAFDPRREARDALELGRALARATRAHLILATVVEYSPTPMGAELYERYLSEDSKRLFDVIAGSLEDLDYETRLLGRGSPPRQLQALAEEEAADLIVVGASHRGRVGRLFPGSTGERLLHGATCAVAVAPMGLAGEGWELNGAIGVGVDGSPESRAALSCAAELALSAGVPLKAIGVKASGAAPALETKIADAAAVLPSAVCATVDVREGEPAAELIAASERELDLLVVGSRGYGPLGQALLGSVSARVMREAASPAIVLPRAVVETAAHADQKMAESAVAAGGN